VSSLIWYSINFIILVAVVGFFSIKKLNVYFSNLRGEMEAGMKEAGARYQEVKDQWTEIKKNISEFDSFVNQMKIEANRELEFESQKLKAESERVLAKLMEEADLRIKISADKAQRLFEEKLLESAIELSKKRLRKEFEEKDESWTQQMVKSERRMAAGEKSYGS